MKPISPAIALSLFVSLLPTFQASALPFEPDYPCYMQTRSGQIVNLAGVCAGKTLVAVAALSAPLRTQTSSAKMPSETTKQAANRGQVVEVKREVKDNGVGSWILSGQVQNQTQQPVGNLLLTLKIQGGSELITQNIRTTQSVLAPGEYASFETTVTFSDPHHRPDFHVVSVQWANQDGTSGSFP